MEAAFSPSLLSSAAVVSQPHAERKSVLVEANALFINDMTGVAVNLQRYYRQGYALDARNSAITEVRGNPDLLVLEVLGHYATPTISLPTPGSPPGAPVPTAPRSVPDPRSLFMTLHYSLAKLPEHVMAPRKADGRIGYFSTNLSDYTDDLARSPRQRYVNRWRLDKQDPTAALSEPVKAITFWLDRTLPLKYRDAVTAGVLEWNKAFEAIGFKDAIHVEVQPDDASWDTLDFGRASLRWMTNASPAFGAIGPSHVDPRSGEILDADIGIESLSSRNLRALRSQVLAAPVAPELPAELAARGMRPQALCEYADQAAEQLGYALDVLGARGDLDPAGPEAEKFVQEVIWRGYSKGWLERRAGLGQHHRGLGRLHRRQWQQWRSRHHAKHQHRHAGPDFACHHRTGHGPWGCHHWQRWQQRWRDRGADADLRWQCQRPEHRHGQHHLHRGWHGRECQLGRQ